MHGVLAPMACRSAAAHGVAAAAAVTFSRAPGGPLVQLQLPSQRCVRFSLAAAASAGSGNDAGASATPPAAPHPVRRRRAQRDVDAGRTPAVVLAAAMQRLPPGPGHVPRPLQGADGSSGTQPAPPEQPPVLLVDGYSLAFRAFHGMTARPGGCVGAGLPSCQLVQPCAWALMPRTTRPPHANLFKKGCLWWGTCGANLQGAVDDRPDAHQRHQRSPQDAPGADSCRGMSAA